jgi:sortase A
MPVIEAPDGVSEPHRPPRGRRRYAARRELGRLCADIDVLAREVSLRSPDDLTVAGRATRTRRLRLLSGRLLASTAGVALVAGGMWIGIRPLYGLFQRDRADDTALTQWHRDGSQALVGSAPDTADSASAVSAPSCGAASAADSYALVSFPSLIQYAYAGVAGDGTWDLLRQRSMVHYHGSAAPGAIGNAILAFHREPHYEHIDELAVGDIVGVQDRTCRLWHYRITQRWVVAPESVTQLVSTADAELTLVTCDPWFRDNNRIVWRGSLVEAPMRAASSG